jgi:hypothetical protein
VWFSSERQKKIKDQERNLQNQVAFPNFLAFIEKVSNSLHFWQVIQAIVCWTKKKVVQERSLTLEKVVDL